MKKWDYQHVRLFSSGNLGIKWRSDKSSFAVCIPWQTKYSVHKNEAGVLPLTGFLCVYPIYDDKEYIDNLWKALNHPDTLENLKLVGKSYGSGAIKVEPGNLNKLQFLSTSLASLISNGPIKTLTDNSKFSENLK